MLERDIQATARKRHRARLGLFSPQNPGEQFFTPDQWRRIGAALGLSARELQVAALLFQGLDCAEMAARLRKPDGGHVSRKTVHVYLKRLREKTQTSDTANLVLRIVRIHQALSVQEQ